MRWLLVVVGCVCLRDRTSVCREQACVERVWFANWGFLVSLTTPAQFAWKAANLPLRNSHAFNSGKGGGGVLEGGRGVYLASNKFQIPLILF